MEAETDEINFRFAPVSQDDSEAGVLNLADDARLATLACCVASQQSAGFKDWLDLRQVPCPKCAAGGFNTGWGYWKFACGAEVCGGDITEPCGKE